MGSLTALFMEEENQCCKQLIFLRKTCCPSSNLRPPTSNMLKLGSEEISSVWQRSGQSTFVGDFQLLTLTAPIHVCSEPQLQFSPSLWITLLQSRIPGRHSVQSTAGWELQSFMIRHCWLALFFPAVDAALRAKGD